jgi:DUF4097 and DUF4098 domain-containing protein YvlB
MARLRIVSKSGSVGSWPSPIHELTVEGGSLVAESDGSVLVTAGSKNLHVRCAPDSDLIVGTMSGSVHVEGTVGAARVVSKSGSIVIEDAREVDARTGSGRVTVGACAGQCRVVVTSGSVRVGKSGSASVAGVSGSIGVGETDAADVKNVSGRIKVGASGEGRISIRSVSGTVEVSVPETCAPATHLKSISGRVRTECAEGTDGEIDVKTVSGTIRIVNK